MRAAASTLAKAQSIDESALVRDWVAGDHRAFDALYQRYFPALVRLLRPRAGAGAEDLAQETMIRALAHVHRHDPRRPLWPWLRRIATNAAIDAARSRARGDALTRALAAMPRVEAAVAPVDSQVVDQDLLDRALGEVPDRQRAALERCYVQGWRPMEAAADFGVGSNAFDQLLHRARCNLRRAYLHHEGEEDHAAHLGWLAGLLAPLHTAAARLRHLGTSAQRLTESTPLWVEGVAATVLAGAVVVGGAGLMPDAAPDRTLIPAAGQLLAVTAPADPPQGPGAADVPAAAGGAAALGGGAAGDAGDPADGDPADAAAPPPPSAAADSGGPGLPSAPPVAPPHAPVAPPPAPVTHAEVPSMHQPLIEDVPDVIADASQVAAIVPSVTDDLLPLSALEADSAAPSAVADPGAVLQDTPRIPVSDVSASPRADDLPRHLPD